MEKKDKMARMENDLNFIRNKVHIHDNIINTHIMAMENNLIAMNKLVDILKNISIDIEQIKISIKVGR